MSFDQGLLQFASVREAEVANAIIKHGSQRRAATALGLSHGTISSTVGRLRRKAAVQGYSPEEDSKGFAPEAYFVKGKSTYYDSEGKVRGQWVKTSIDHETRIALIQEAFLSAAEDLPRLPKTKSPKFGDPRLMNVYTLTDCHVGMYAWAGEGGEGWDLAKAEATIFGAFEMMITNAPKARTAVVAQLGDFLHFDGLKAVTPRSGHVLESDGRFQQIVQVAIRLLRRIITLALETHEKVIFLCAEGNHDIASSVWMRAMFSALYEKEPRLTVIESEIPYYALKHGKTMLSWHHGHMKKLDQLPLYMATQFPSIWGGTTKRYCHTGDKHHAFEKEYSGIRVIQHPTLAAGDEYAARNGWHSAQEATCITYHDSYGQVGRHHVSPEMLT